MNTKPRHTMQINKSDQYNIPDLFSIFLDALEALKSSDPELYKVYQARSLQLFSDARISQ